MKAHRQRAWLHIVAAVLLLFFFIIAPRLSEGPANQEQPPCRTHAHFFHRFG